MKMVKVLVFVLPLVLSGISNANEDAKNESISIVNSIIGICKTKSMLACQPQMRGADFVFDYIKLFDYLSKLDKQFKDFLVEKYPSKSGFDFDVIQASLKLSIEITFTPEQFVSRITSAKKVKNGFDVIMDNGPVLQLRKQKDSWVAIFPPEVEKQFKQLEPYYTAGQLKRSILIYRMLEGKMANLSKDKLEANVSEDIAPILVAMFTKEKVPTLAKWLVKDVNEVIKFYGQFSTIEDMKAHIVKTHKL